MIEINVIVKYKGRHYQTNVIARKGIADEEVKRLAEAQVSKQWGN